MMINRILLSTVTILLVLGLATLPNFALALTVTGTSDPWLAGMPDGSTASLNDVAPDQSPVLLTGISLVPGLVLTFSASGGVGNGPAWPLTGPDGDSTWVLSHLTGAENGISDITAPIRSLLGVFLNPGQPDLSPAPGALDYSLPASRSFLSMAPGLQQVFFIGDGLTGTGSGSVQEFIVPSGATRLFLGTMDGYEWNNNIGEFTVNTAPIPEPCTMLLVGTGLIGVAGLRRRFKR